MIENVPIPIDKFPLYAKQGMFEEYYNIVVGLTNKMADILHYRRCYDRDTGQDLSQLDPGEIFTQMDDETRELSRVKGEAGDFLDVLGDTMEEEGEAIWDNHELELGDWIERLIYHKHACESELFDLDEELDFSANRQAGKA